MLLVFVFRSCVLQQRRRIKEIMCNVSHTCGWGRGLFNSSRIDLSSQPEWFVNKDFDQMPTAITGFCENDLRSIVHCRRRFYDNAWLEIVQTSHLTSWTEELEHLNGLYGVLSCEQNNNNTEGDPENSTRHSKKITQSLIPINPL